MRNDLPLDLHTALLRTLDASKTKTGFQVSSTPQ